jgi:hypothetical protein
MKAKYIAIFTLAAGLLGGSLFIAQAQSDVKPPPPDPRIDKLLEQNEKILKNQDAIMKELDDIKEGVLQARRRTS